MIRLFKVLVVFTVLGLGACTDSNDDLYMPEQGIYVLNGSAESWAISFYQFSTGEVIEDYYTAMNPGGQPTGETAVCFAKRRSYAYILTKQANGDGAIHEVDFVGFKNTKTISGFDSPAAFIFLNDSVAVVSNAGANPSLSFCDFSKSSIVSTLALNHKPGQLLLKGKYFYIAHPEENLVSVVDHATKELAYEITTLDNPSGFVVDATNDVWIYCQGAGLTKIKHLSWENELIREDYLLDGAQSDAAFNIGLAPSGAYVYYFANGLKRHFINNSLLPEKGMIDGEEPRLFGGFNIDDKSGNIYYLQRGVSGDQLMIYQSNGKLLKALNVAGKAKQTLSYY